MRFMRRIMDWLAGQMLDIGLGWLVPIIGGPLLWFL